VKQILQSLKSGQVDVADVPCPAPAPGYVLIRSTRSLISAGTERMLVEFGKASLVGKARSQPDKVKQVWDKMATDGIVTTVEAVLNKLDQPLALGYCNVGRVLEPSAGSPYAPGDRVVSNGKHAEVVSVPVNLCARVPDAVSDDEAAFTVLGAIALQGIRLIQPGLGEAVAVTGLGAIGLMAVQLLRAQGCRVLAIDLDPRRLALARSFGAETVDVSAGADPVAAAAAFSRGRGMDAVLIAASTESNEPVHQAAAMCRTRGRIVLVGVTGLELSRADFYQKELSFQVSCSYGPGRYDPSYEEKGADYPVGFVRWTAQRNFEAVLDMMAAGKLDVRPLITHRVAIAEAPSAYASLTSDSSALGVLLEYPSEQEKPDAVMRTRHVAMTAGSRTGSASLALIGSGNYATAVLIPAFKAAGARLRTVCSRAGVSGVHAARKFGFESATTDAGEAMTDPEVSAVAIATRHDTHARLACEALAAGKHVFVEKPLAITHAELDAIETAAAAAPDRIVMVGFNRRFAPHAVKMKSLVEQVAGPRTFVVTVNAGAIPSTHWTQDASTGGGRIVGEACHFIDLLRFLAGSRIVRATSTAPSSGSGAGPADNALITLHFEDGSMGTIAYLSTGHKSFPKERVEVFAGGRVLQLDNFRRLRGFGWPGFSSMRLWRQDKGQKACAAAFVAAAASNGTAPIPFGELMEVSRVTVTVAESLR
jgi:predicted dehydrogenase/threonine dehydrogenase-like Zn-dependent dehydrogenase